MNTTSKDKPVMWRRMAALLLLVVVGLSNMACSVIQKVDFNPGNAHIDKHPVRVALVLDKSFCQLSEYRDPGYTYPLGDYLAPYARYVSQQAFAKVTECDSLDAALKCRDADAILVPKFVKLETRARGMAWDPRHALVVLEWTMKNIKDQKTLWLATAEGRADGTVGTAFDMDPKDRQAMQEAMDDLYAKSVAAFNQSAEIKTFAQSLAK